MAYCRKDHPLTFEQLAIKIRLREFEYQNYIRPIGREYKDIMMNGGLKEIRVCIGETPEEERPWPYRDFHSYKYDHDFQLWLDTHPRATIYPITSIKEYEEEKALYKEKYYK